MFSYIRFRIICILILCIFLILYLAACSTEAEGVSFPDETVSKRNNTTADQDLVLDFLYIWPEWQETMNETIYMFENANPGIKISPRVVTWDRYYSTLQVLIHSDEAPDVSFGWNTEMVDWVRMNAALDITDEVSDLEDVVRNTEWLRSTNLDNKIYAIPFRGTFMVIYYNDELFQNLDISPPVTVDEFEETSKKLLDEGIIPLSMWANPPGILLSITREFIRDYTYNYGTLNMLSELKLPMDNKAYFEGTERLMSWYDNGYIPEDILSITSNQSQALFRDQGAAMLLGNNNEYASVAESVEFRMGISNFPTLTNDSLSQQVHRADGFFVLSKTDYPEESIDFLRFLISPKIQQLWMEKTYSVPVIEGLSTMDNGFDMILNIANKLKSKHFEGQFAKGYRELVEIRTNDIDNIITGKIRYEDKVEYYEQTRLYTQH